MAYTHTQYEVIMAKDAALSALADVADWAPGVVPHVIRAVAVVVTNDLGGAGVVKIDKRPAAGSDTGRGDGDIAVVNLPATAVAGDVIFVDGLNVELLPGEEAVAQVTDLTAAGDTAHIILYVEPRWELPGNILAMKASV